jgi:hypothetical protein
MQEQLISFETAKLAKEKGFEQNEYDACYTDNGQYYVSGNLLSERITGKPRPDIQYSAPTQSLLQKWIREVHKINVEANRLPNINKYRCLFVPHVIVPKSFKTKKDYYNVSKNYYCNTNFDNYEQALEIGLQEALKLIPNVYLSFRCKTQN